MSNYVTDLTDALNGKPATIVPASRQTTLWDGWDDPYRSYAYDGYRSGYSTSRTQTLPKSTVSSRIPKVDVIGPDGTATRYTVPADCDGWFDIAKDVWPTTSDIMRVPLEHCQFSYGEPVFNACVYTATNDYMQARWGRKLDDSDRRWLAAHPHSTDGGVPQEYTATCIDQLVQPYGMRVSRVRLRKGSLVLGDSIMGWIQALGCNPFAMADRVTTNAEAAERMGISREQADQLWRVEFHDDPLPCSIVGERGWSNSSTVATGSLGGHARYLAPRARAGDWFVSVQLDVTVTHLVTPPNPEYVPRKGSPTLLLGNITGPDKQLIAVRSGATWAVPGQSAVTPAPTTVVHTPDPHDVRELLLDTLACYGCGTECTDQELCGDSMVCLDCASEVWQGYSCPHCKETFGFNRTPTPTDATETAYQWSCPSCHDLILVDANETSDPLLLELTELAFSTRPLDDDIPFHPEVA